jgi:hypothetical protein
MNPNGVRTEGDWLRAYEDGPDFALTLSILADGVVKNRPAANILIASALDLSSVVPPLVPAHGYPKS